LQQIKREGVSSLADLVATKAPSFTNGTHGGARAVASS
jgi:hypothetical protein